LNWLECFKFHFFVECTNFNARVGQAKRYPRRVVAQIATIHPIQKTLQVYYFELWDKILNLFCFLQIERVKYCVETNGGQFLGTETSSFEKIPHRLLTIDAINVTAFI
jgi:hypothetical protein